MNINEHLRHNFKKDDLGNTLILKSYKIRRMKELTTEINKLEHERNKIDSKLHDLRHWLTITKSYKTFNDD